MLPTCRVHCAVHDNDGSPIQGATITARLNRFEVFEGYVVPDLEAAVTDEAGVAVLALWPNALGATASTYDVRILAPNGKILRLVATVPNVADVNLHQIANLPAYDGKSDGQLIIDAAVAAVAPAVAAQFAAEAARDSASAKVAEAEAFATSAHDSMVATQSALAQVAADVVRLEAIVAENYAFN